MELTANHAIATFILIGVPVWLWTEYNDTVQGREDAERWEAEHPYLSDRTPAPSNEWALPDSGKDSSAAVDAVARSTRPALRAEMRRYSDIYSDVSVNGRGPRTLVYTYTYRAPVYSFANRAAAGKTFKAVAKTQVLPAMRAEGVTDPAVKWVYKNPDGTVVATFKAS
jgi:hypothetical protein